MPSLWHCIPSRDSQRTYFSSSIPAERFLLQLPDNIDLRSAALIEPLSVADHCVVNRSPVTAGHGVVVTGPTGCAIGEPVYWLGRPVG